MAFQPETATYDAGVYQLEMTDAVLGGVGNIANAPLLNLADRTAYLKQHVDNLESGVTVIPTYAPLNSPAFTGSPTAPTQPAGDNSTKIANTAWVDNAEFGIATVNVAGGANVTLTQAQWGCGIIVLTGAITANINVVFPVNGFWIVSNQTTGTFTITAKTTAGTGFPVAQGKNNALWGDGTNIQQGANDYTNAALLGVPTAPTPAAGDNSTKVATTAFIQTALGGTASVNVAGNTDVTLTPAQYGNGVIILTGALTGNIHVIFPVIGKWIVSNATTGNFTITAKTAAGTGVLIDQSYNAGIFADGTNIQQAQNDFLSATVAVAGVNVTLSAAQAGADIIVFTGTLTANINVVVPNTGSWIFVNSATGAFTITVKTSAGTGVVVAQGSSPELYANGTNVVRSFPGIGSGLRDDGAGNVQTNEALANVTGASTLAAADHATVKIATAAANLTIPHSTTLWNGWGFIYIAGAGAITITPNASDTVIANGVAQTLGAAYVIAQGNWGIVQTDGAGKIQVTSSSGGISNVAFTNVVNAFTKSQGGPTGTLTDAATITWDASLIQVASVTLGGNRTLALPTNLTAGQTYILIVHQDATGSRTLAYASGFKWVGSIVPILSTAASAIDILSFVYDGTSLMGNAGYAVG